MPQTPEITLVTPVLDEVRNLDPLCARLVEVMDRLAIPWEALLVDDGSRDGSAARIREIHARDGRFGLLRLSRNFGQTAALAAGFDHARGDLVVTLDADLQNDPDDIPRLLEVCRQGFDVVSGWRRRRTDPWLTRILPSRTANWLIARVTGVPLHDFGCGLSVYRRQILRHLVPGPGMHRLIPAVLAPFGARITEVEIAHRPRSAGSSKYGLGRTGEVLLDLAMVHVLGARHAGRPPLFQRIGAALVVAGAAAALPLALWPPSSGRWPWLTVALLLVVLGLQSLAVGSLVERMVRSCDHGLPGRLYEVTEFLPPAVDPHRPESPGPT